MNSNNIPEFSTIDEATQWMLDEYDDGTADNLRFAFDDDPTDCIAYESSKSIGCCGSVDLNVIVAGRLAMIGCNYGH